MKSILFTVAAAFLIISCVVEGLPADPDPTIISEELSDVYDVFYGHLHNHTSISGGRGTPAEAYAFARDVAGLDFMGLADHAYQITPQEWEETKAAADAHNQDGVFVTFWGFEWSHTTHGHVTVTGTSDYCTARAEETDSFTELIAWLETRECIAILNHPGREDEGEEFGHFTNPPVDRIVGMELWNKSDGFSVYYDNDGYYPEDGNLGYYDEINSRGWRTGAAGSEDNHKATWGTAVPYRMAVWAETKTRQSLYNAIIARRFYSTLDKNIYLYFEIAGSPMGSIIPAGTKNGTISLADGHGETFSLVELIKNGEVAKSWTPEGLSPLIEFAADASAGDYFYIRVTQPDGDQAISSPIFIDG